jgi:predicted transcriptional regulator
VFPKENTPRQEATPADQSTAMIEQAARQYEARLTALRQAVSVGLEDFDAGRLRAFRDGKTLRDHLIARAAKVLG